MKYLLTDSTVPSLYLLYIHSLETYLGTLISITIASLLFLAIKERVYESTLSTTKDNINVSYHNEILFLNDRLPQKYWQKRKQELSTQRPEFGSKVKETRENRKIYNPAQVIIFRIQRKNEFQKEKTGFLKSPSRL